MTITILSIHQPSSCRVLLFLAVAAAPFMAQQPVDATPLDVSGVLDVCGGSSAVGDRGRGFVGFSCHSPTNLRSEYQHPLHGSLQPEVVTGHAVAELGLVSGGIRPRVLTAGIETRWGSVAAGYDYQLLHSAHAGFSAFAGSVEPATSLRLLSKFGRDVDFVRGLGIWIRPDLPAGFDGALMVGGNCHGMRLAHQQPVLRIGAAYGECEVGGDRLHMANGGFKYRLDSGPVDLYGLFTRLELAGEQQLTTTVGAVWPFGDARYKVALSHAVPGGKSLSAGSTLGGVGVDYTVAPGVLGYLHGAVIVNGDGVSPVAFPQAPGGPFDEGAVSFSLVSGFALKF